jgi:exopolyphosphatase/guanosine-5'-triphosphate,3'-diphosphate pyrophosphatase
VSSADLWARHDSGVRVGVIDVGSNTVRLLVTSGRRTIDQRRAILGLGASVEATGAIPDAKLAEVADCVSEWVRIARRDRVERLEVLVTSPGRQAENGDELIERLAAAARVPVRLLSGGEEGRLAFVGAVSRTRGLGDGAIAVCDVGGGSAQVTIGTRDGGPAWSRSIDIGSRRLTSRCLGDDPPGAAAVARARAEVVPYLEGLVFPAPKVALAVGGSARSLRKLVGGRLDHAALERALELLARTPADQLAAEYDLDPGRASTLAAGAVILVLVQERLGLPLRVGRGGIREGAALELAARAVAA